MDRRQRRQRGPQKPPWELGVEDGGSRLAQVCEERSALAVCLYDLNVPDAAGDWMNAPEAAQLLGLQLHTVYALIDRGELRAEVTVPTHRSRGRRSVRLHRQALDDYLAGARLKPGELKHLFPPAEGRYR